MAFIRGVGQTDLNFALEPGVGLYIDDVYYPTLTGVARGLDGPGARRDRRFVPYGPDSCDPNRPNDPYLSYATFMDPTPGRPQQPFKPVVVLPRRVRGRRLAVLRRLPAQVHHRMASL